jgi:hypothetical protein
MKTVVIPIDVARRIAKVLPSEGGYLRKADVALVEAITTFRALIPTDAPCLPTPGPYRIGRHGSCIVADHPVEGMNGSDAVNYYGGHMVAESIARQNAPLLAAAWDLYEALEMVRDADEDCKKDGFPTIPDIPRAKIDAALAKAEGKS